MRSYIRQTAVKTSPTGQAAGSQPLRPENRQNLNELCAKRGWPMPDYFTVSESDAATDVRFTYGVKVRMLGKGEGATVSELVAHGEAMPSIKKAKDSAAIRLLRKLEGISKPSEAR